jgi:hypothetical protein
MPFACSDTVVESAMKGADARGVSAPFKRLSGIWRTSRRGIPNRPPLTPQQVREIRHAGRVAQEQHFPWRKAREVHRLLNASCSVAVIHHVLAGHTFRGVPLSRPRQQGRFCKP